MHALHDAPAINAVADAQAHFRRLERQYRRLHGYGPFPAQLSVASGSADLAIDLAAHPREWIDRPPHSLIFHALGESARYACNSHETTVLMQPLDFSVRFLRPGSGDHLYAHAVVCQRMTWQMLVQAELMDRCGRVIAVGHGAFARSEQWLDD